MKFVVWFAIFGALIASLIEIDSLDGQLTAARATHTNDACTIYALNKYVGMIRDGIPEDRAYRTAFIFAQQCYK